jgi:hypothetical protein
MKKLQTLALRTAMNLGSHLRQFALSAAFALAFLTAVARSRNAMTNMAVAATSSFFLLSLLLLEALFVSAALAQSNGPCEIIYLVRNENGEPLDPANLDAIVSPKVEEMKTGIAWIRNSGETITQNVKCLKSRLDIGGRPVTLSEMTLKYAGRTMRLLFNVRLVEETRVIDSIAFQDGTFQLNNGKWEKLDK